MRSVALPDGAAVPAFGQGTWMMGERGDRRRSEIAALREGVYLGMALIDTAEMYGDGAAETIIRETLGDRRDKPSMAYSPVEQGRLPGHDRFVRVAGRLGATPHRSRSLGCCIIPR